MLRTTLLSTLITAALCTSVDAADLRVTITGARSADGTVSALLVDSAGAWDGQAKPVGGQRGAPGADGALELAFADLSPGHYAVRVMHDENDNGKFDTNPMGMPLEGYGFSNNPQVMRAATFDEARFEVADDGAAITIELR